MIEAICGTAPVGPTRHNRTVWALRADEVIRRTVISNFIAPEYSRSRVAAAGRRVRHGNPTEEDHKVIENWRAAHAYVLNTIQTNLRNRARRYGATVAQRSKRRITIYDKLQRQPDMALSHMQDIAGCRVIFNTMDDLLAFRAGLHESRSQHVLLGRDIDQYNYLIRPKNSGYRGIHDVYRYKVSSPVGTTWNGLLVEIQYRTLVQHAWATAVEVADLTTSTRIKFDDAANPHLDFFRYASEMLARAFEGSHACCPDIPNPDLVQRFVDVALRSGIWMTLNRLEAVPAEPSRRKNSILIYRTGDTTPALDRLRVLNFENSIQAIHEYGRLEKEYEGQEVDIVLVRAETGAAIREAYRNYYSDVESFLDYVRTAIGVLTTADGARAALGRLS